MKTYKPHYACFKCKKTFKRKLRWDEKESGEAKCPQCGALMANMGLDFESPKKENSKVWRHLQDLYSVGITFHSCGCTGPGYIPKDKKQLIAYFQEILTEYNEQLIFWRNRNEPSNQSEIQSENNKFWENICLVPFEQRKKGETISNMEAIKYWLDKIKEVELKIDALN
ncbi:hypothetical protein [Flavobacterium sp.]|uniref:hypothetical protein n=1 Tax=Flavobacterium sp. TaxID=239 RepID=UPI003D0FC6CA